MNDNNKGYIYCLSNLGMPGIFKIGKTNKDPLIRAKSLYTTGTPYPFNIEICKYVKNVNQKEKLLHNILEKHNYRCNPNREFFKVDIDLIKLYFKLLDGDDYEINVNDTENNVDYIDNKKIGCRDPSVCFSHEQKIRHTIEDDIWIFKYDKIKNTFIYNNKMYTSMHKITKQHYQSYKPERCSDNNAWKECECLVDNKWISTYNL